MLLWTFVCKFLCEHKFIILFGIYLGEELLGYTITLCLTFCGPAKLFSCVAVPVYIPTYNLWGFQFIHILSDICSYVAFFIMATIMGVKWYPM